MLAFWATRGIAPDVILASGVLSKRFYYHAMALYYEEKQQTKPQQKQEKKERKRKLKWKRKHPKPSSLEEAEKNFDRILNDLGVQENE